MENNVLSLMIFTVALLSRTGCDVVAANRCPACSHTPVPYPLSTGPDCGDQSYKVQCNAGTLWFNALNGSSYVITSINPLTQRLIIRPPSFAKNTCVAADFRTEGMLLDSNLPFNITSSNTVVLMNCSNEMLQFSLNCSSTSICHNYIRHIAAVGAAACGALPVCCWYKTGGSSSAYRIRVREERCSAYESFVNLDTSLPVVSKWPEPGVEKEWALPQEPVCKMHVDCRDLANSACLPDRASDGQRRCLCKPGFRWDPINGVCKNVKCRHGRGCKRRKSQIPVIAGSVCAVGTAMVIGVLIAAIVYKQRQHVMREAQSSLTKALKDILNANNSGKLAKIFTAKEISRATNNFSKDRLLGSGGYGEVFKAILDDGTVVAVKRAKLGNNNKGIDQILNEVRILCQVNHRSLVRLLGCCVELEHPLIVYEYIPNGTLFEHLHGSSTDQFEKYAPARLSWNQRLSIAHQTAEGLSYLHTSAVPRIYHRDIKSSNILLNETLDAKVSDFGLSRPAVTEASHITTSAQGTLGYLDPEYYLNFQLTDKSDVYSFGVVDFEESY